MVFLFCCVRTSSLVCVVLVSVCCAVYWVIEAMPYHQPQRQQSGEGCLMAALNLYKTHADELNAMNVCYPYVCGVDTVID